MPYSNGKSYGNGKSIVSAIRCNCVMETIARSPGTQ